MMAWIKSYQEIERHPKTIVLMKEMNWSLDMAISKLHRLWWWCADYAADGDISKHDPDTISTAIGCADMKGDYLIAALLKAGFVDKEPYLRLHDWWAHFGDFLRGKYSRCPDKWQAVEKCYTPGGKQQANTILTVGKCSPLDKVNKEIKRERKGEEAQTPPTILQVRALAEAEGLKSDPDKFFHWQESKAWAGIIEWQAAFRYWCKTEYKDKAETPKTQPRATVGAWQPPESDKLIKIEQEFHVSAIQDGKCVFCKGAEIPVMGCNCAKYSAELGKRKNLSKSTGGQ